MTGSRSVSVTGARPRGSTLLTPKRMSTLLLGLCTGMAAVRDERNIVTPMLPHSPKLAQQASRVVLNGYNATELYSGFFTIDAPTNSHTYFLFSKAASRREDAPVLLWLNGGPGASSLIGFFTELGPFGISDTLEIVPRAVHWNLDAHLLALDNPLGTGFSFTGVERRMATNQTTIGADLYEALQQFFDLFPNLRANPFYATGESYAGKYIPAVAHTIHMRNIGASAHRKIKLMGIAIGDGAFDPPSQMTGFGPLLFSLGMADTRDVQKYGEYDEKFHAALARGDAVGAFHVFDEELNGDYFPNTYYANTTKMGSNYFNFATRPSIGLGAGEAFPRWLNTPQVAEALHVGSTNYTIYNQSVETKLIGDWVVGVVPWLEVLMEHYHVLIYSGQNDIILGPSGTQRAMDKLQWSGAREYASAPTLPMFMKPTDETSDLAGYVRQAKSMKGPRIRGPAGSSSPTLSYVVLRGCGHMVPQDQPLRAYEMLRRFLVPMAPFSKSVDHSGPTNEGSVPALSLVPEGSPPSSRPASGLVQKAEQMPSVIPAGVPRFSRS